MIHIENQELLTSIFGKWPSFHDAEILHLSLDSMADDGPSLELKIHLWKMTRDVDDRGFFILTDHTKATLRFGSIALELITGFSYQNVLFDMIITPVDADSVENSGYAYHVSLQASCGVEASFACRSIRVVDATPLSETG